MFKFSQKELAEASRNKERSTPRVPGHKLEQGPVANAADNKASTLNVTLVRKKADAPPEGQKKNMTKLQNALEKLNCLLKEPRVGAGEREANAVSDEKQESSCGTFVELHTPPSNGHAGNIENLTQDKDDENLIQGKDKPQDQYFCVTIEEEDRGLIFGSPGL